MLRYSVSFSNAMLLMASLPRPHREQADSLGARSLPSRAEQLPQTLLLGLEDFLSVFVGGNVAIVFEFLLVGNL